MPFDETYYNFIEELDRHQREAFSEVSALFEDARTSPDQDPVAWCRELPEAAESASKDESRTLKQVQIPIPDDNRHVPGLALDETGVFSWVDPMSFDENGKKVKFRCPALQKGKYAGQQCFNYAGYKTDHYGIGYCIAHGGAKKKGKAHAGWMYMHAIAQHLNVSPWDALLGQIRLLAGQVAWLTQKTGEMAEHDDDLLPDGNAFYWMELLEQRGERLAKVSKMAIDAGIAERMMSLIEDQAQMLNQAVKQAAIELQLDEKAEYELITSIARNYQAIEQKGTANA
jgi:hypothetical protein